MLKKLCSSCKKIIPYGNTRCSECEAKYKARSGRFKKDYYKKYNNKVRQNQNFYNSKAWDITRKQITNRDRGLCVLCYSKGKITYYDCIHHIEEVKDNVELRCDDTNLISLCNRCHRQVHAMYDAGDKAIKDKLRDLIK